MQCLNRRRRYQNMGGKPFWYNYATIQGSSSSYRIGLSAESIGDAAIFAGGGTYTYRPSAYATLYGVEYADYINKNLVSSNLADLSAERWCMGSAVVDAFSTPATVTFSSTNLENMPSNSYAYVKIGDSNTQWQSGTTSFMKGDVFHIYLYARNGYSGVYLYRRKSSSSDMPDDYSRYNYTYNWDSNASGNSYTSVNIELEYESSSGSLNCTILLTNNPSEDNIEPISVGKRVFFIGGAFDNNHVEGPSNVIDMYLFGSGAHTTGTLDVQRAYFGCSPLDNKIFIAGGRNRIVGNNDSSDYYNKDLVIYNSNGYKISENTNALTTKKYRLASAANNDYVMFAGGTLFSNFQYRDPSNTIDVFNKNGQKVTVSPSISLTNTNLGEYGPSAISFKQNFLICTNSGMNIFNQNLIALSSPSTPNRDLSIPCVVGNYALFGGGIYGASAQSTLYSSRKVFCYNGRLILNELQGELAYGRYDSSAASINKKYAIFGGSPVKGTNYLDVFLLEKKSDAYIRIIGEGFSANSPTYQYGSYLFKETGTRTYTVSYYTNYSSSYPITIDPEKWEEHYLTVGTHYFRYNSGYGSSGNWYKVPSSNSVASSGTLIPDMSAIGLYFDSSYATNNSIITVSISGVSVGTKYTTPIKLTEPGIYHVAGKTGTYTTSSTVTYTYTVNVGTSVNDVQNDIISTSTTGYTDLYAFKSDPNSYCTVELVSGSTQGGYSGTYTEYVKIKNGYPLDNPYKETN